MRFLAALILLPFIFSDNNWISFYRSRDVECTFQVLCNGDLCSEQCVPGTVVPDKFANFALNFQRNLASVEELAIYTMPGAHNAHISSAYGFGIEFNWASAVVKNGGELTWNGGDLNLGEGVDQYLSVYDQLTIGIRHLEIDIWWGPWVVREKEYEDGIVVCHTPESDPEAVQGIEDAAKAANISLNWDYRKLGCGSTYVTLEDSMGEIRSWLDANPDGGLVIIYFDTKWPITTEQAENGTKVVQSILGDVIWTPAMGNPTHVRVADILAAGKRVIIENQHGNWSAIPNPIVFTPALWDPVQFGGDNIIEYPTCTIDGSDLFGKQMTRALDDTVTSNKNLPRRYKEIIELSLRCGVPVISPHMMNPIDMRKYVWTWAPTQPNTTGCAYQFPSGRWAVDSCTRTKNVACSSGSGASIQWLVTDKQYTFAQASSACPNGYKFDIPTNPRSNALLNVVARTRPLWINYNQTQVAAAFKHL